MIEIVDEGTYEKEKFVLYIGGDRKATLVKFNNLVGLNWEIRGPQYWPQAKELMQGLLELSITADRLYGTTSRRPDNG